MVFKSVPIEERFWGKVNKNGPIPEGQPELGPCWVWIAGLTQDGYGKFRKSKSTSWIGAHRISWTLCIGLIPKGLWVLHKCDNPSCVNPDHLFLGNAQINTKDREQKGRGRNSKKEVCIRGHPFEGANLYIHPDGHRGCRACGALKAREYRAKKKKL